ncbi:hypothetical protein B0H66DRAFT_288188 [Apodospora peruviana]|uniref:Uncharacterized protein n=1 Tax=Apodospora peruviana TaxID=516989 RepID=A0AAE0M375_9PEZI|nr:hypothetical protein B0H66DRAFT_288188 [Apodospora peruviana]
MTTTTKPKIIISQPLIPVHKDEATASKTAKRIAEIHLTAMDFNPLLHAQFPLPQSLRAAEAYLAAYYGSIIPTGDGILIASTLLLEKYSGPTDMDTTFRIILDNKNSKGEEDEVIIIAFATWEQQQQDHTITATSAAAAVTSGSSSDGVLDDDVKKGF